MPRVSSKELFPSDSPIEDRTLEALDPLLARRDEMIIPEREFMGLENPEDMQNFDFCPGILGFASESELKKDQSVFPPLSSGNQAESGSYQALQNRIMELEARIHDLEFEKHSVSGNNNTNSTVSNSQNLVSAAEYRIKINDFSPEWDFVEGGSKMMVCFSPNLMLPTEDQGNRLLVMFGNVESRAFCIQPGVLKCYGFFSWLFWL